MAADNPEQPVTGGETPQTDSTDTAFDDKLDKFIDGGGLQPQKPESAPDAQTQGEEQATEQTGESQTQEALEEIDFEGERFQVPPKLKAAFMRQADYTQKTQAVAERERMVALQIQRQQLEHSFQQSVQQEHSTLAELEAAIKQYNNVDWQALDTDSLVKTRHALDMLKERRADVQKLIDGKRGEFETKLREVNQKTLTQANEFLSKHIPQWGVETQNALMAYGQNEGYSDVELGSIRDPRLVRTLWKASQWDKLQAAKPLAAKRTMGVPPVVRPGAVQQQGTLQSQTQATVKQLHQAKDPDKKKELFDKALDLKLSRMLK